MRAARPIFQARSPLGFVARHPLPDRPLTHAGLVDYFAHGFVFKQHSLDHLRSPGRRHLRILVHVHWGASIGLIGDLDTSSLFDGAPVNNLFSTYS